MYNRPVSPMYSAESSTSDALDSQPWLPVMVHRQDLLSLVFRHIDSLHPVSLVCRVNHSLSLPIPNQSFSFSRQKFLHS